MRSWLKKLKQQKKWRITQIKVKYNHLQNLTFDREIMKQTWSQKPKKMVLKIKQLQLSFLKFLTRRLSSFK